MKITSLIYKLAVKAWAIFPFKKGFVYLIRFLEFPVQKYQKELWFEGSFKVTIFEKKFRLYASRGDFSAIPIFWNGLERSWDSKSIYIWAELAKISEVIFDIGANIGIYSLVAKTVNAKSRVFAFEPSRASFGRLKKNISVNQLNIQAIPWALSDKKGLVKFYDLIVPTAISSLKLNENLKDNACLIEYDVPVTTVKEFVVENNISKIDLISIDVELNEPEVLAGMEDLIKEFKPNFIIEILNEKVGGKVAHFFRNLDYLFFYIDESFGLVKVDVLEKMINSSGNCRGHNFLICQKEVIKKISFGKNQIKYY